MTTHDDTPFAILLDGALEPTDALRRAVAGCRVIAADGGIRHALPLGLSPELWIGDFDSASPELEGSFADVPRAPYPADKVWSDGELAAEEALARGATSLLLVGGLGGARTDHALFNLTLALRYAAAGHKVVLTSGTETAWPLLPGPAVSLPLEAGHLVSVIGLTDLQGLTVSGVRWPLEGANIARGSTRTLSNESTGNPCFNLEQGEAIILARQDSP